MKLCMSHYNYKSIPDAKFEAGSSSSFGDMMSQNFPRNFQAEKIFSFSKFSGRLDEKRAAVNAGLINFAKIWSEHVSRIESKSHQVWVS